ncbi:MAG: hypothetical protein ACRCYO_08280, partial [Bacteroidia bacterium]
DSLHRRYETYIYNQRDYLDQYYPSTFLAPIQKEIRVRVNNSAFRRKSLVLLFEGMRVRNIQEKKITKPHPYYISYYKPILQTKK